MDLPDALLARTGSGTSYFSLAILRQFQHLGVPVINSSRAIETVKDKRYRQQLLAQVTLPIPRTMLVRFPVDSELVELVTQIQRAFWAALPVLLGWASGEKPCLPTVARSRLGGRRSWAG